MSVYDNLYTRLRNEALLRQATRLEGFAIAPEIIRSVVLGGEEFTIEQTEAILDCRNSLRYFHKLVQGQYRAQKLLGWQGGQAMLQAAADGDSMPPLDTEDGLCTLRFLQQDGDWRMLLSSPDLYEKLEQAQARVQVLDHAGNILLVGQLDEDAELEGPWPFAGAPREYFEKVGHSIRVVPVF